MGGAVNVRDLRELAERAQSAEHAVRSGGWLSRCSPGLPSPRFQLTPGAFDPRLDEESAARGYQRRTELALMIAGLAACPRDGRAAVAEEPRDGWAGVFAMVTLPGFRGRGVARAVLGALAGWSAERADGMCLQVELGNAAAIGLYRAAGFAEAARFHYRSEVAT
ncbi:GNAT family N-acetyltransferase [Actinokineospora sp. G85]|uniref:GNAT family N-acetyltransferase n=1 Tax=Actinokineospora sp. G85 TaxID=3406626 RepID=UPI003C784AA3